MCDVIVYRVSQKTPKTIENDLHMVNKSKFKRKVFLLLFVNLRGKLIFNVIYRLVSSVENQVIIYWLMRCVILAHSTHGGRLPTVSIINKVAFAQVGFYLVKKYWTVSKRLIITLRHYILCFCLLLKLEPIRSWILTKDIA